VPMLRLHRSCPSRPPPATVGSLKPDR
jgi:hypothetical protein